MNIVQVGSYPLSADCIHGGIESSVYGLAQQLAKSHIVDVFDFPRIGGKDSVERCGSLTIHRYKNPGKYNQDAIDRSREILRDIVALHPNVVHIHGTSCISGALYNAVKYYGIPVLLTIHGLLHEEKKKALLKNPSLKHLYQYFVQTRAEHNLLNSVSKAIVDTEYVKEKIYSYKLSHTPALHIIPQGIDKAYFDIDCDEKSNIILSVGSISPRKGHIYTVDMYNILRSSGVDAELHIVGSLADEEYYSLLMQKIEASPFKENITLKVNLSQQELLKAYSEAKLFVLHSREESQGIVFAEAMATGLPVVATKVGGIPFVVEDGISGLLCKYGDVYEMAKMVSQLLIDETNWHTFSAAARKISRNYDWKIIADKIEDLYSKKS